MSARNEEQAAYEILSKLSHSQSEFTADNDVLVQLILLWVDKGFSNREIDNNTLFYELKEIAKDHNIPFNHINSVSAFSQKMRFIEGQLNEYFEIERYKKSGNRNFFKYRKRLDEQQYDAGTQEDPLETVSGYVKHLKGGD